MGNKVSEVVNDEQNAGVYETDFGASKFASGVYLYRINVYSNEENIIFSDTKKMILIK